MILDTEAQQQLLLVILSEHTFAVPGKALGEVALEIQTLANAITEATISAKQEDEDVGIAPAAATEDPDDA